MEIRVASAEEFAIAVDWAAGEGWNPGLDDMAAFHAADPQGFLLGWEGGAPIASISVVRYGAAYSFLGFYIVAPERRGQGLGLALWTEGMARMGDRTVGLDGVVAQQENYRRSGFALAGRNIRFTGVPRVSAETAGVAEIAPPAPELAAALLAYDRAVFAAPRDAFTRAWATPGSGARRRALAATVDGAVIGYGVVRDCRSGAKIGPLFADDAQTAERLFAGLCAGAPEGAEVSFDTPENNAAAVKIAESAGLSPSFETARMYRGRAPEVPLQRWFGVTTFELG